MIQDKVNEALNIIDEVISATPLSRTDRVIIEEALGLIKQMANQGAASLMQKIQKPDTSGSISVNRAGLDNTISNRTVIG